VLGSIPNTRGKKKIKDKNLMLISIAAEKYLTKLNILSRKKKKKTLKKIGLEGVYHNITEATHDKQPALHGTRAGGWRGHDTDMRWDWKHFLQN
jgi:hypothetical protein